MELGVYYKVYIYTYIIKTQLMCRCTRARASIFRATLAPGKRLEYTTLGRELNYLWLRDFSVSYRTNPREALIYGVLSSCIWADVICGNFFFFFFLG